MSGSAVVSGRGRLRAAGLMPEWKSSAWRYPSGFFNRVCAFRSFGEAGFDDYGEVIREGFEAGFPCWGIREDEVAAAGAEDFP